MKRNLLVAAFVSICSLLCGINALSEDKKQPEPATKLEQFLSKTGEVIVKDFYSAGDVDSITVHVVKVYEVGKEAQSIKGLRIEVREKGRQNVSFLDTDEVEGLRKAIWLMRGLIDKFKGMNREYTEVVFSTKGNFTLGCYQKGTEVKFFVQSGGIGATGYYFSTDDDLATFGAIVDKGLSLLQK